MMRKTILALLLVLTMLAGLTSLAGAEPLYAEPFAF